MANTYSQINIHCVFAVKGRGSVISNDLRPRLHEFISGIIRAKGCYPLAVGGWSDHVHVFFELPTNLSISDVIREAKSVSSKWINEYRLVHGHFAWQEGYGAFSHSKSQRDQVIGYIMNQEEHHRIKSFKEEFISMLNNSEVEFDARHLFEFYED